MPTPPKPPALDWTDTGAPRSTRFDDIYYADQDGHAESRHVFLGGANLPAGWADRQTYAIGELGFGVGLNFLTVWDAWAADPARSAHLAYAAVEAAPPAAADLRRAIARWPRLVANAETLLANGWPPPPGHSHRNLGSITLELWIGDVAEIPDAFATERDAWFLDGFSPAKNPEMWSPETLAAVARRTRSGGRVATYAAAGWVRRNLQSAGFEIERRPGFGTKREMLAGALKA